MLWLGLSFALLSSLGWAGFDVTRKQMVEQANTITLVVLINLVQLPGFILWSIVEASFRIDAGYFHFFWGSLLLNLAAHLLFLRSVQLSALSSTVPLLGMTPVFAALVGMLWGSESGNQHEWLGITAVMIGAFVLNARPTELVHPWRLFTTVFRERGSLYMTLVALLWSVAPFFDKRALEYTSVGIHGTLLSAGIALSVGLALVFSGRIGLLRVDSGLGRPLAIAGLCALVGFGCQLLAIQYMLISLFEGLKRGIGMILSIVSGRLFFHESISFPKLIAVALMTAGVMLLVLASPGP